MSGAECLDQGRKSAAISDSGAVAESLNACKNGLSGLGVGVESERMNRTLLEDGKKFSLQALSPGAPTREKLWRTPNFASNRITPLDVYWLPRSEWKTLPLRRRLRLCAAQIVSITIGNSTNNGND